MKEKAKEFLRIAYKYRYLIALLVVIVLSILKVTGSSIGVYAKIIQPNINERLFNPIFGLTRGIRSDEWVVEVPKYITQYSNNFSETTFSFGNFETFLEYPVKDIRCLIFPYMIPFFFLNFENAYAFYWWFRVFALLLVAFEFCMIITNKNKKISFVGMILIGLSPAIYWWLSSGFVEFFMCPMLLVVLLDKYFKTKKWYFKLLCVIGMWWSAITFTCILYPAIEVPLGLVTIALIIWIICKNIKEGYKIGIVDILFITILVIGYLGYVGAFLYKSIGYIKSIMATEYPGNRSDYGGDGINTIFSYIYNMIFPYSNEIMNNCVKANFYSLFPIPMILIINYLRNNKKNRGILIALLVLEIFFVIYSLFGLPALLAKITLLSYSIGARTNVVIGFIETIFLIYILANYKDFNFKINKLIILLYLFVVLIVSTYETISADYSFSIATIVLISIFFFIILVSSLVKEKDESSIKNTCKLLIIILLISTLLINPIQVGTSVLTNKPIAKKVKEIVIENSDKNIWIVDDVNKKWSVNNYYIISGAHVINTTQLMYNENLWKTVLEEEDFNKKENREIYNRYAHIELTLVNSDTSIKLKSKDYIYLELNVEKLKDLNVHYVITERNLMHLQTENIKFEEKYQEDGWYIYEVIY